MVTFDSGKIVLSRFDCYLEKFEVILMLNAEENAVGYGSDFRVQSQLFETSCVGNVYPKLTVDSSSSLACALLYGRSCFFVPLKSSSIDQVKYEPNGTSQNFQPFIVDLVSVGVKGAVHDICFLPGYLITYSLFFFIYIYICIYI